MGPSKRSDSRHFGEKKSRSHHLLPIPCIEIPAAILPSSSSVFGLIVADNFWPQVTPGGAACGSRCGAAASAAPLRVLLLPPASSLPCDTLPHTAQDVTRRLLRQPGTGEDAAADTASAEAREDFLAQSSVLRLARQARLARELLAVGYQIAGVWLRVDQGEHTFEDYVSRVVQQHQRYQQHSLISSMTSAIVKANASSPQLSLVGGKEPTDLRCCFVFFPSRNASRGLVTPEKEALRALGYYTSGSNVASLVIRRLPVVIRQAEHPLPPIPLMRSVVYSTFLPLQLELSFVPSKTFTHYFHARGQQLSAALASQLCLSFAAVLSPPILASCVVAEPLRALTGRCMTVRSSSAPQGCGNGAGSSMFGTHLCRGSATSSNEKAEVHSICTTPKKVAEKPRSPVANSDCPTRYGINSTLSSIPEERPSSPDLFVSSCGESARYMSVVLSDLSENAWDRFYGETNFTRAYSCSHLCFLQPLLVGDVVSRYEILLDFSPEPPDQRVHLGETSLPVPVHVKFRVVPCDDTYDVASSNSFVHEETEVFDGGLSSVHPRLILSVKGEFVAAVVAGVNASVEHLRKSLSADAAAAVAPRIVERLADAYAAYCHLKRQQEEQKPHNSLTSKRQGQQSASQSVASLEIRRFYLINLVRPLHGGRQSYDGATGTLLLSDFTNSEETQDAATGATVERFEFLLGVPPAAVVPHSILKDGGAAVALRVDSVFNQRVVPHELDREHQQSESITHMLQQSSAQTTSGVRSQPAAGFWNDLQQHATKEMTDRQQAHGGVTSASRKGDTSRILLCTSLVLLTVVVAMYILFSPAARINERDTP